MQVPIEEVNGVIAFLDESLQDFFGYGEGFFRCPFEVGGVFDLGLVDSLPESLIVMISVFQLVIDEFLHCI